MVLFPNTKTITLFNKYIDENGNQKYNKKLIKNVNWSTNRNATITDKGLTLANSILIFMNLDSNYIKPKAWQQLTSIGDKFTLEVGDKIAKGDIPQITKIADLNQYDDVVTIKGIEILSNHIEVECT